MNRDYRRRRSQKQRGGSIGSTLTLFGTGLVFVGAATFAFIPANTLNPQKIQRPGERVQDYEAALGRATRPEATGEPARGAFSFGNSDGMARSSPIQTVAAERVTASFTLCHSGGGINCVVDGDTAWIGGTKVRIADIDAPETHPPRCAYEAELGAKATHRLQDLLNAGPFELRITGRSTDRYGRALRVATRHDQSIGNVLVFEGLARPWEGARQPWC